MNIKNKTFLRCCYGYGVSGMSILVVGAILPALIREAGLSYGVAGGLLSMMAIGNLLASLFFPILASTIGKRLSISLVAALVPISYLFLTFLPSVGMMYVLMLLAGVARGSITIINNVTVNQISNNSNRMLNLLHCSFAIGAFLAPFLTALLIMSGFSWRSIMYLIVLLCTTSTVSYATMPYAEAPKKQNTSSDRSFLKSVDFYFLGFMLFFYLGMENCINGWFITYLKDTGIMSEAFATTMVSFTWLAIMGGRLLCAALSQKYSKSLLLLVNAIGSGVCFFLLVSSSQLVVITIALLGLGFFLAGIYPGIMASAGPIMKGSTLGMAVLTGISAVGGIITPQIVGSVADRIGLVAAVGLLSVNAVVMILLAILHKQRNHSH